MKCKEFGVEYLGNYKKGHKGTMIRFICPRHEDKGVQESDWSHFKDYAHGCRYCSGRGLTTVEAQKKVLNPNIIFISEYHGAEKPIKCHCNSCGNEWVTNRPIDLFKREGGCPTCSVITRGLKRRSTHEDFEKRLNAINPNIELIGKYTRVHDFIKCRCKIHGIEWESIACNLLNESAGCPICNASRGETELIKALQEFGIKYTTQKTFIGCRDVSLLRFDAYDITNNIAYEFQGEQHYTPVDFTHNNPEAAYKAFDALQRRDNIKKEYCAANNIRLICIPYWERGNIRNYLLEHVNEYNKEENTA